VLLEDSLQRLLNRHIAESTVALRHVAALEGRSFAVEVDGLALRLVLQVRAGRVALGVGSDAPSDATVRGAPLALLRLLEPGSLSRLRTQHVELLGSVHVAEEFAALLQHARPDLEGELAGWIGDIAAHRVGVTARRLHAWTVRAGRALEDDVADYLQQERAYVPAALEARAFYADVEQLRDAVERAEQRLERIARRAAAARE
jgi:ubiquinone biosynthesis protein UbiJ